MLAKAHPLCMYNKVPIAFGAGYFRSWRGKRAQPDFRGQRYLPPRPRGPCRPAEDGAPAAELRPNQTDQDSLPPYELPLILEPHVEQSKLAGEIITLGFDEPTVRRVLRLVRLAEFKRKLAVRPGISP